MLAVVLGASAQVVDVLNNEWTGVTDTKYTAVTGLTASSDAVYSVQCAGGNSAIQLRSNNSNSGIVTTTSGGTATKVKVTWNSNTNAARALQVYGSNTAYTAPSDLYSGETAGDLLTTFLAINGDTEFDIEGTYAYIGFRSASGALYIDKIEITWATGDVVTVSKPTISPANQTSFIDELEVSMENPNTSGAIHYTLDGTDPTAESAVYNGPFTISETTDVKAIVIDADGNKSGVATAHYSKLQPINIAMVHATDAGENVAVKATCVATAANGIVLADETGLLYVYEPNGPATYGLYANHDYLVTGTVKTYGGAKQLTNNKFEDLGRTDPQYVYPQPVELTGADLDATATAGVAERKYVTYTGTLGISGNYWNITVDGAENAVASIVPPLNADNYTDLNGEIVQITGFQMYVNSKYVYTVATEIKKPAVKYNVEIQQDIINGTIVAEPTQAAEGETVTLTVTPDAGYFCEQLIINFDSGEEELQPGETANIYTFTMPAADVTVQASFAENPFQPVDIDVANYQNGWLTDMAGNGVGDYFKDVAQKEHYNGSTTTLVGPVLYQNIEGLQNGTYTVKLVANASFTDGRGFTSDAQPNELGRVVVFANDVKQTIPVVNQVAVGTNNVVELEGVVVSDGTLYLGIEKIAQGSNWHTIQITGLTYTSSEEKPFEGMDAYWQNVRNGVVATEAYASITGSERINLANAEDAGIIIADLPPFFDAKAAYNTLQAAITAAKDAGVDTTAAEEEKTSPNMNAARALELAAELNIAARDIKYADASEENPMETDFVVNPSFNDGISPWLSTTKAQNQGPASNQPFPNNPFYENWHPSNYTGKMYQVIENIPNGIYELKMWAFANTFDGAHQYVYANGDKTYLTQGAPAEYTVRTIVVDRKIEIGLMQDAAINGWLGVDDAVLTYYGKVDFKVALAEAITAAEAINAEAKMNVDVKEAFTTAYATGVEVYNNESATEDDVVAATTALQSATSAATSSIAAYAAAAPNFDAFKAEVESTNVVSAKAKETMEAFLAGYENSTLTDTEVAVIVNPTQATAWRQNPTQIGEYILSAWDEVPYNWNSYHPNTWSAEGDNDGSNFRVPFIEYWTGDGESLGEKTLTATVTDLTPGIYEVKAWTRVRLKNGAEAPATGITLQVGDGDPVDVTTGENISSSQFYIGEFTATGVVGDDGVLTVKYNVAAENNISWLAFKNVNYTRVLGYAINVPDLTGATVTTNPEGDAYEGTQVSITVETEEGYAIDAVTVRDATGAPVADVEPAAGAANVFFFTMPAQDVTIDVTLVEVDPNDYTYLIENPAYLHEGDAGTADYAGWTWSPAPGESGWKYRDYDEPMNLVTYSGNVNFSFEQTIPEVPAGQYRLSVYGFYRAGSAQDEANRVTNGDVTHNLNMFAEVGDAIFTQPIMNLYEGAAEEDVTGKGNHCVVPGYESLFVPDGAVDSRAFYLAGYYRNDLIINITEAGEVKIGINHPTGMTYDGDYAPIGGWELYKVGDIYNVNVSADIANGTVTATPAAAIEGTSITLAAEPAEGFYLESLNVVGSISGDPIELAEDFTFTMPAEDVKVTAEFLEIPSEFTYTYEGAEDGQYEGAPVTIDIDLILAAIGATDGNWTIYSETPDGRVEGVRGSTDGWRNEAGVFTGWSGDGASGCVYYVQDSEASNTLLVGRHPSMVGKAGEYTATLIYVNNATQAEVAVNIVLVYPGAEEQPEVVTVGQTYTTDAVAYDYSEGSYTEKTTALSADQISAICDELGIESLDDAYVYGYNPTTEEFLPIVDTYGFDGWRDANGDFHAWTGNKEAPICAKYDDGTTFYCYNISGCPDAEINAYWAYGNEKGYAVLIEIPFVLSGAPEPPVLTYDDLNIIDEQGIEFNYDLGTSYQEDVATVDMAAIKAAFGTPAEPELTIYAVASDNTLDPSYGVGTSDGWRNADGDWESWSGESVFCVKADFEAESDQIYYVGTKWAASQTEDVPGTYVARYVFVNEDGSENPDAVLFTVTINYGDAVGINGILADKTGEQKIFDLSGRRIETITKGGMYIINGKKVFVK